MERLTHLFSSLVSRGITQLKGISQNANLVTLLLFCVEGYNEKELHFLWPQEVNGSERSGCEKL